MFFEGFVDDMVHWSQKVPEPWKVVGIVRLLSTLIYLLVLIGVLFSYITLDVVYQTVEFTKRQPLFLQRRPPKDY